MASYRLTWYVNSTGYLRSWSKLIVGACELVRRGVLEMSLRPEPLQDIRHGVILWWDVEEKATGRTARVVIELADSSEFFDAFSLGNRSIYFKRSFRSDLARQASTDSCRILPFGLNHSCLGRRGAVLLSRMALAKDRLAGRAQRPLRQRFASLAHDLRLVVSQPSPEVFENHHIARGAHTVLYQTRIWEPEESSDNLEALNEERVSIVRALRQVLGTNYIGGIKADAFASAAFPDVVVHEDLHRRAYAKLTRDALIGVYTRGIHHSLANKLSEYLAAGLCIVSEPMLHELPVPLTEGRNYLLFNSPGECAAHCRWLIDNPSAAMAMREANLEYYRAHVAPGAHLSALLRRCFE